MPAFFENRPVRVPGQSEAPPGPEELLLLLGLGLLRLLGLLRFLSHSILSRFNGLKRDTRHARRRASLAISSSVNSADSQRAASRCHAGVIALSTVVMHFDAVFRENVAHRSRREANRRISARKKAIASPSLRSCLTAHQRHLHQFKTTARVNRSRLRVR